MIVFLVLLLFDEPEASWVPSPSGFREAESEWGHQPQAGLALLRVRIPILRPNKEDCLLIVFLVLLLFDEPEASWVPSPSGFREAESEWGHQPQAGLALLRVRIPILRPQENNPNILLLGEVFGLFVLFEYPNFNSK